MRQELDLIDRKILRFLQEDGKMKIKEIAASLNMTTSPIFERIKRLEKSGAIQGYTALVDKEVLGYGLVAFCTLSLERHHKEYLEQFEQDVNGLEEVLECYHIAGIFDYLLKIYVKDMEAYQEFIAKRLASLANIGKVNSSFVMTEVKMNRILPV